MNESLIGALKRNNRIDILAEVVAILGATEEQVAEIKTKKVCTVSLIDRSFKAVLEVKTVDELVDEALEELSGEEDATYFDIAEAIEHGERKVALKLIKQAKKDGHSGSVLKELKKQAKEIK